MSRFTLAGFYQMCLSNFHNRFGNMQVFLSFGVYYDGLQDASTKQQQQDEEKKTKEEAGQELNNTLGIIEVGNTHTYSVNVVVLL